MSRRNPKTDELTPDVDSINELRRELLRFRLRMADKIIAVTERMKKEQYQRSDLCDLGWQFREMAKLADEIRKECNARQELAGKLIAFRMTEEAMNDPARLVGKDALRVRGRFATGTPDVSQNATVPRRDSPEYVKLCRSLGIPDNVIESGVVDFSFTRLSEMIATRVADGQRLPDGITKTYPVYRTTFRTLNDVKKRETEEFEDL